VATEVIVFLGEIGGTKEYAMLGTIRALDKPVVTMVVGRHAPRGRRMGHAGALIEGARGSAEVKIDALRDAGAHIAPDVLSIPRYVKELLDGRARRYA